MESHHLSHAVARFRSDGNKMDCCVGHFQPLSPSPNSLGAWASTLNLSVWGLAGSVGQESSTAQLLFFSGNVWFLNHGQCGDSRWQTLGTRRMCIEYTQVLANFKLSMVTRVFKSKSIPSSSRPSISSNILLPRTIKGVRGRGAGEWVGWSVSDIKSSERPRSQPLPSAPVY